MGSASRIALADTLTLLNELGDVSGVGAELLQASAELSSAAGLLAVVADAAADSAEKSALIDRVFAPATENTKKVLKAVSEGRWSNPSELLAGVEELGLRAEAITEPLIYEELIAIEKVISSDHELELTLGSKLVDSGAKAALIEKLFNGKVSAAALNVTRHVVMNPRGRRVGRTLLDFAVVVANQGGNDLATVTVAAPLDETRLKNLEGLLSKSKGHPVKITTVIDPQIIGGMRIRIGDEVIDGTVKSKLDDLRLKLAV